MMGARLPLVSERRLPMEIFEAICRKKRAIVENIGSFTIDGWNDKLGAAWLSVRWHFIDQHWTLHSFPVATLNISGCDLTAEQLCHLLRQNLQESPVVHFPELLVFSNTSDLAPPPDLATTPLRCTVHTIALAITDAFEIPNCRWQKYLDAVTAATAYFKQHSKANALLNAKQAVARIPDDIRKLVHCNTIIAFIIIKLTSSPPPRPDPKDDNNILPTDCNSRVRAMLDYLCLHDAMNAVKSELQINDKDLALLGTTNREVLTEFVVVLAEVHRVAKLLELQKATTVSRAPRLLRELCETLQIMAGQLRCPYDESGVVELDVDEDGHRMPSARNPLRKTSAQADAERDKARRLLRYDEARKLAQNLARIIDYRLGLLWQKVTTGAVLGKPGESSSSNADLHRWAVTFHLAAFCDVNECALDFLDFADEEDKQDYFELLAEFAVQLMKQLDVSFMQSIVNSSSSTVARTAMYVQMFACLHSTMLTVLAKDGRKEPDAALTFWRDAERNIPFAVPSFCTLAKAVLSAQASSTSIDRLSSKVSRHERSLPTTESLLQQPFFLIKDWVLEQLNVPPKKRQGGIHSQATRFEEISEDLAFEVFNSRLEKENNH